MPHCQAYNLLYNKIPAYISGNKNHLYINREISAQKNNFLSKLSINDDDRQHHVHGRG